MRKFFGLLLLGFLFVSCAGELDQELEGAAPSVSVPLTAVPTPTLLPPTTLPPSEVVSGEEYPLEATYTNPDLGFSFDYPGEWQMGRQEEQSRGGFFQLVGPGGDPEDVRMQVTVLNWDPKQDLEAFLDVRRTAWENSGIEIRVEEEWTWAEEIPGKTILLESVDGSVSQVYFTYLGDRYLEFSTTSEHENLERILETLRLVK